MVNDQNSKLEVNPKIVGEMELPVFDLSSFEGLVSSIKEVEFHDHPQHGVYAKVVSEDLEGSTDDNKVYAVRILGLFPEKDEDGVITGYGWGADTKTGLFLKKHSVTNLQDLIGKRIVIRHENKKDGKQYLNF